MTVKRLMLVWVMMLCMMLICGVARAVEWEQYAVEEGTRLLARFEHEGKNTVTLTREYDLVWERDGEVLGRLLRRDYPGLWLNTVAVPLSDGRCAVVISDLPLHPGELESYSVDFGLWSPEGLVLIAQWSGNGCRAVCCDQGVLVTFVTNEAHLYTLEGELLWSGSVGEGTFCRAQGLQMLNAEDWVCSLIDYSGDDNTRRAYARVTHGERVWLRDTAHYSRLSALPDGRSVMAEYRNDGQYGPVILTLLDDAGRTLVTRRVEGDRLITDAVAPLTAEDGSLVVYGTAVANSRHVYQVWRLTIRPDLSFESLEVRNAAYHGDYSLAYRVFPNDLSCWLTLRAHDGSDAPTVVVPYDALPVVTNHTLRYE